MTITIVHECKCKPLVADLLAALKEMLRLAPAKAPGAGVLAGIEERHSAAITAARSAIASAEGGAK